MMLLSVKNNMLKRVVRDIASYSVVNLGMGYPLELLPHIPDDLGVIIHSENGISGVGPALGPGHADRNLIDAGGGYVSVMPGTAFFDSATSFAMIRSGRLDMSVLGAFEVSEQGDLANWTIPNKFTPGMGGAVELAQKAKRVHVIMTHCDKHGNPKIKSKCELPLTAAHCVDRIYTDLAVIDVTPEGLILTAVASHSSVSEVIALTAATLTLPKTEVEVF
jgi:3-oxoacid CoA-transferase subunit B